MKFFTFSFLVIYSFIVKQKLEIKIMTFDEKLN